MVIIAYSQDVNYPDVTKTEDRVTVFDADEEFVKWFSYMWKEIVIFAITRKEIKG